jgi:hypothetical protein
MNLFSLLNRIGLSKTKALPAKSPWQLKPNFGQGPYTKYFQNFVPRKIDPDFFEFLREAIPVVDAAINRLVSLDGHLGVKGDNEALVDEIQDWVYNVPVNDLQKGVQAFHQSITSEAFEQGFSISEFVTDKKRTNIVGLRTGDSKYIRFKRSADGMTILQKSDDDHEYRPLKPDNLMYFSIHNENQNPYGTPLMRSCEFVSQILVTIQNSVKNVWERFGDPSYSIIYKTSKKDGADLNTRRQIIEDEFATAIKAKREGKSADFVRAIDTNSDITIGVIGSGGQVLELEVPARHMLEQIVAKTGLPPWMLGMHWSTTERLSNAEAEMLLADVATRQAAKLPLFYNLIKTMLLLRGRTWKKGDWRLEWAGVNLHDVVQQAQARFLNAQADYYYLTNARDAGIDIDINDLAIGKAAKGKKKALSPAPAHDCTCKELYRAVAWSELDHVEFGYENNLKTTWAKLLESIKVVLGFPDLKQAKEPEAFVLSTEQVALIMKALKEMVGTYAPDAEDSPVTWYYGQATSLGYIQAANLIGKQQPILNLLKNKEIFETLTQNGFALVKNQATLAIKKKILPEMQAFSLAGSNPLEAARHLERMFGDQNASWERLARSEMTLAAEEAKLDEWAAWGEDTAEFMPAPGACPLCKSMKGEYALKLCPVPVKNTHPRCRCSLVPGKGN